jgi:hypothetical protein
MANTGKPRTSPLLEVGDVLSGQTAIGSLRAVVSSQAHYFEDMENPVRETELLLGTMPPYKHISAGEAIESARATLSEFAEEISKYEKDETIKFPLSENESAFLLISSLMATTERLAANHPEKDVFERNSVFLAKLAQGLYRTTTGNLSTGRIPERMNNLMYLSRMVITQPHFLYKENIPLFELYIRSRVKILKLIPGLRITDKVYSSKKVKG